MSKNSKLLPIFIINSLLVLTTLSSVTAQTAYPGEFVKRYVDNCTAGRGEAARSVCQCIIQKIQERYSYEEFKKIDEQIQITGEIPSYIVEQIYACQAIKITSYLNK